LQTAIYFPKTLLLMKELAIFEKVKQENMLKVPLSYLIVQPEKIYENEFAVKGLDGKSLVSGVAHIDQDMVDREGVTTYTAGSKRVTQARVVAVPGGLKDEWVDMTTRESDIHQEVRVGDVAYFHFNSLTEDNKLITPEGEVYRVPYSRVYCVSREGEIIMIGGWALVEPTYPDDIEVSVIEGEKCFKRKGGFLYLPPSSVKEEEQVGILRHIGTPLKGRPTLPYKAGDTVLLALYSDIRITVEGKEYFRVAQSDLLGTI
jgi:co-chaperonin GroES (HSP10)